MLSPGALMIPYMKVLGVPSPSKAPWICLRRALKQARILPPDRGGESTSGGMLAEQLDRWRQQAGISRREILGALEVGAQRVLLAEYLNALNEGRRRFLESAKDPRAADGASPEIQSWWQELHRLMARERGTIRSLARALPMQAEKRVKEAIAARRAVVAHLKGMGARLGGEAFWRMGRVSEAWGVTGLDFHFLQLSGREREQELRKLGYIPVERASGREKDTYRIVPGFRHRFWTATVQRLHTVVAGKCADPLATTYDILTLFFPEWWPVTTFQGVRDRRREAARLRTKLKATL